MQLVHLWGKNLFVLDWASTESWPNLPIHKHFQPYLRNSSYLLNQNNVSKLSLTIITISSHILIHSTNIHSASIICQTQHCL